MIRTPTVFVLGAGASAPYGFPLGYSLGKTIYQGLRKRSGQFRSDVGSCLTGGPDIDAFIEMFAKSGASIDAFLEKRHGISESFGEIGRLAIARALMPFESEEELNIYSDSSRQGGPASLRALSIGAETTIEKRRARRWYHYLFNQMLSRGDLAENKLSIITFNFDRSFERALFHAIEGRYGGTLEQICHRCSQIPIVHVHGMLGAPQWLTPSPLGARGYHADELGGEALKACAASIRIVHDEIDPQVLKDAHQLIENAKRVCFLGFSFHHLNLNKLGLERLVNGGRELHGTSFGVPFGAKRAVSRDFTTVDKRERITLHHNDVLSFLEETEFIHE